MFLNPAINNTVSTGIDVTPIGTPLSIGINEGTDLTKFSNVSSTIITLESVDFTDGSYSVKIETTSGVASISLNTVTWTLGKTYTINFWAKVLVGTTARVYGFAPLVSGTTLFTTITNTAWTEYSFSFVSETTTVGEQVLRWYASFGGSSGDTILLDKFLIIETD